MRFGIRETLFLFVLLAVPIVAFWFVFKPRNAEIMQAKVEVAEKLRKLTKLQEMTSKIDDLEHALQEGRQSIALIEAKLPAEQQVDMVLKQAWEIARTHDLQIKKVEPDKKVPASQYMELPIKVELSGNFDGFYEFLLELEQLPRLTQIKNLSMKRISGEEGAMTASFVLSVYFEPQGADGRRSAEVKP